MNNKQKGLLVSVVEITVVKKYIQEPSGALKRVESDEN